MEQVDRNSTRPRNRWTTLAIAAISGAGAMMLALPATVASADPVPPPPPPTTAAPPAPAANPNGPADGAPGPAGPTAAPPPADPLAAPPGADPNVPAPPPPDPNAPQPGRVDNPVGGFSYVIPAGWVESDATHLDYGSALLSKQTAPPAPGQPPAVANDTRAVLGKLDQKLYANAESDNTKAANRLASDMGEFFMPYPGTRINQDTTALTGANGLTGSASYYEVKFSDTSKPNGQIWTGVIGSPATTANAVPQRWFVVWLGTGNDPVDKAAAKALAESIQPATAPAAPPSTAGPAAPTAPTTPAAPTPTEGQAPAGENTPTPGPERSVPA